MNYNYLLALTTMATSVIAGGAFAQEACSTYTV